MKNVNIRDMEIDYKFTLTEALAYKCMLNEHRIHSASGGFVINADGDWL